MSATARRQLTPQEAAEKLAAQGTATRTLPRGYQWLGHDIPGRGAAAKRRLKQMATGVIPRICTVCHTDVVPIERAVQVCDGCLSSEWMPK